MSLVYIQLVLNPRPRQEPSLQIFTLPSEENSLKVTIEANTQGGPEVMFGT